MEASGERLGFMRAIAANPSDETARLAFRDWLEENGDPVRAEFIRVQTEWAVLGPTAPTPDNIGRAIELTERSRELLAAHESDWRRVECRAVGPHHGDVCDDGRIQSPNAQFTTQCHYCHGSGDVGGLLRERDRPFRNEGGLISHVMTRDPVEWTRGHVSAVACRLGDCLEQRRVRCARCRNGKARAPSWDDPNGVRDCEYCHGTGQVAGEWAVTEWAKAVVRWFPVVEFRTPEVVPHAYNGNFAYLASERQGFDMQGAGYVPGALVDAMVANGEWFDYEAGTSSLATEAQARAALARAVAAVVRAAAAGAGGRA